MTKIIRTAVGILYHDDEFLILKKQGNWTGWQFVQGAMEKGETPEKAVVREIEEETGLKELEVVKKLDLKADYWFMWEGEKVHKFLTFLLVNAKKKSAIKLSREHSDHKWCSYEEALREIKYDKKEFEKAYIELQKIKSMQKL
jgi:8-oxo-dGTP pyrophosphatase MutT (NUDIX family)